MYNDQHLQCRLEQASLERESIPSYKALSHVWRYKKNYQWRSDWKPDYLQWPNVEIGYNLHTALRNIWTRNPRARIWLMLCPSTRPTQEKSLQVDMMHSIFARAESVIIWLGENDTNDGSSLAGEHFRVGDQFLSDNIGIPESWRTRATATRRITENPWLVVFGLSNGLPQPKTQWSAMATWKSAGKSFGDAERF